MRVRGSDKNYKGATMAIFSALTAASRPEAVNLQAICTLHKISVNYPSLLRSRGYVMDKKRGISFWNPELPFPCDEVIEEMRAELLQLMARAKKPKSAAPQVLPLDPPVVGVQGWLPLTAPSRKDEFISALSQLHRATAAMLSELGGVA